MKTESYDLNGEKVVIPIPESYKDCMTLIKSDRYRISGRIESSLSIVMGILKPFSPSILFWLRLSQYKGWLWPVCRVMYARASRKAQVQIPVSTKIGYGFYIGHNICMVVNGGTVIGNNVNLSQFLNIGTLYLAFYRGTKSPFAITLPPIAPLHIWATPCKELLQAIKLLDTLKLDAKHFISHFCM